MMKVNPTIPENMVIETLQKRKGRKKPTHRIQFRNGYSKDSPSFVAKITLSIGTGKEEWGADKGKEYFVLTIKEIV